LIGLLVGAVRLVLFWFKRQPFSKEELWLVYGISVAFFLAHSIFWRFGIFNSFGLLRVFMGVLPLFALIIVQGLNGVFQVVRFPKLQWAVAIVAVGTMFWYLKKHINIDYHLAPTSSQKGQNILLQKYAAQYKDYTYYFDAIHPALALDLDWFDPKVHRFTPQLFTGEPIPSKSIVLWDDWFSKDESNMPLENLLNDARFQLIECLETGYDWEQPKKKNCLFVFDSTFANTSILLKNDFEKEDIQRDTTRSKTGAASLKLDRSYAFSPSFNGSLTSFQTTKQPMIRLSCWVYISAAANPIHHTSKAVISFESSGKSFGYHAQPIVQKGDAKDQWKHLVLEQPIPTPKLMTDAVKVYLWNPDRVPIWVDDLVVEWVTNH